MKKPVIISFSIILTIILVGVIHHYLPFQIKYKKEIAFGNQLVEQIESFRLQNDSIPHSNDCQILESLGFDVSEGFLPIYKKINETDYLIIYCWGFDPPWLFYYSKNEKWEYGFDFPHAERNDDEK